MEKLAWVLDGAIPVPGTGFRFGVDSIIGLVPGVGDVVGLLLGAAILYEGVRIGAPRTLMVRMLRNSVLDAVMGVVPVVGDIADFAFKSNKRNARLLLDHLDTLEAEPAAAKRGTRLLALALLTLFVVGGIGLLVWAWSALLG